MSAPGVRVELAKVFREVAAAYSRLPADRRPDVAWNATDDLLEEALRSESRARALAAVDEWRKHWLGLFREAAR